MASPRPDLLSRVDRVLAPVTWLAAVFTVVVLAVGPELIGAKTTAAAKPAATPAPAGTPAAEETAAAETAAAEETPAAAAVSGEEVFTDSCGGCHTLAAAGTSGATGPNLDELQPDAATVVAVVTSGSGGMPAFEGDLSAEEIEAVADYVATSAGG